MSDDLYNEQIIQAARQGRATARLDNPTASATCDNPLCGDRVTMEVATDGGRITALGHKTRGCLLTEAASAVIAGHAEGSSLAEVREIEAGLRALLRGDEAEPGWPELAMFRPLRQVRSRHECVLLPFEALEEALATAAKPA